MQNFSVHIQHLDAHYKIPASQENPVAIQRRLDRIAGELLTPVWGNRFADMSAGNDEALYFIERMEMDLALELSPSDDHAVAESWAQTLHHGLLRTLSRRDNVIVFQRRSEFLASFLEDLLHGHAWEKWHYRELASLRSLSLGQAALRILAEDGDVGRDALLELARRSALDLLLAALTDAEVEAVVAQCLLPRCPSVILPNVYPAWAQGLRFLLANRGLRLTSVLARDVAQLYLHLLRERPELGPDVNLARFIRDVLQLRQAVIAVAHQNEFLAAAASEDVAAALHHLGRGDAQRTLATLMRELNGPEVVKLLHDLQAQASPSAVIRVATKHGGIFLLAPKLAEMALHDFLQQCPYPDPSGMPKAGLLLFALALQCLGRANFENAQADCALALFAGLPAAATPRQLRQYAEALTPEVHRAFTEAFGSHLRELEKRLRSRMRNISAAPCDNDEAFLLPAEPFEEEWNKTLALVSSTAMRWFAAQLGAFSESSPNYLRRNFLASRAEIEVFADRIAVRFLTCPLQMVLRMAGFDHGAWEIPWLENRKLEFKFD